MTNNQLIVHVPDEQPHDLHHQPTECVFASDINPKHANRIVRCLNQIAPFEDLRHVKRVRKKVLGGGQIQLSIILCLVSEGDNKLDGVPPHLQELISSYQLSPFITKVCKYAATSKEEWQEQCKIWPTSYHPRTYNIDGITGFNEKGSQSVLTYMQSACDGLVVNAAMIVDPSGGQIIASARDHIFAWNTGKDDSCYKKPELFSSHTISDSFDPQEPLLSNCSFNQIKQPYTGVACLYPWQWAEQQSHSQSSIEFHPLQHTGKDDSCYKKPELFSSHTISDSFDPQEPLLSNCSFNQIKQPYTGVACLYPWQWAEQQSHSQSLIEFHPLQHTGKDDSCYKKPELFSSHTISDSFDPQEPLLSNCSFNQIKQPYTGVACLYPWQWAEQQSHSQSSIEFHPLQHTGKDDSCYKKPELFSSHTISDSFDPQEPLLSNCSFNQIKQPYTVVACLYPWQWAEQQSHSQSSIEFHPLQHAAIVAIESSAARDRCLFPNDGNGKEKYLELDHENPPCTSSPSKRQKTVCANVEDDEKANAHSGISNKLSARPYLCTGYDIYLVWEPCTLCAMALVHQRIRRIFYAFPNPRTGALGSVHRLQEEKSLNHHYAVFRVMLP